MNNMYLIGNPIIFTPGIYFRYLNPYPHLYDYYSTAVSQKTQVVSYFHFNFNLELAGYRSTMPTYVLVSDTGVV